MIWKQHLPGNVGGRVLSPDNAVNFGEPKPGKGAAAEDLYCGGGAGFGFGFAAFVSFAGFFFAGGFAAGVPGAAGGFLQAPV